MLSYWFWPNPGNADYSDIKVLMVFGVFGALFAFSFVVSLWRKRQENALTRKLSRSWASSLRWLAFIGIVLTVARVEEIQFLAMRVLWIVWVTTSIVLIVFQIWNFRRKHYTVIPKEYAHDPRKAYLPGKRR
jgi:hypothetical protein